MEKALPHGKRRIEIETVESSSPSQRGVNTEKPDRRLRILAFVTLLLVTLSVDLIGGLERYPPEAMSDEVYAGLEARNLSFARPWEFLTPWNMASGYERMAQVPLRAAQILFGNDLAGGRMAHVLFGALVVAGLYGFARHLIGDFSAWIAALLLAVCHVHVHLSRAFICTGIQSAAAMVLALWIVVTFCKSDRAWQWASRALLLGVLLGWGMQTYKLAYAIPPLTFLTMFAFRRSLPARFWIIAVITAVGIAPLFCPWALWLYRNYPRSVEHIMSLSSVTGGGGRETRGR